MHSRKSTSTRERFSGFKDALKKNNIVFSSKNHLLNIDPDKQNFLKLIETYLTENPKIDGILSGSMSPIALETVLGYFSSIK